MKKLLSTTFALLLVSHAFAQGLASNAPEKATAAAFKWEKSTHDFGKTKLGEPVSFEFEFTNAGALPLIISSVKASCGCTVTAYTREPVEHGATGFVRATFDGKTKGVYSKTVAVTANTAEGTVNLTIRGEIIP